MKTNKLNKRLHGISSLSQLHLERDRIEYKLGLKELDLKRDMEEVKEALTFSNICRTVWDRIELPSFVSGLSGGFSLFSGLFGKKRKKHSCSL